MSDKLIVLTTYPDQDSALKAAQRLVREKLAACVNILPAMTSVYMWEGKETSGTEHLLLIKTRQGRYAELERSIRESHPYELPEIVATPMTEGLAPYLNWIDENTA